MIAVIATARSPVLVKVTACAPLVVARAAEANATEAGDAVTCKFSPVPLRLSDGPRLPNKLPVTTILAWRVPVTDGRKVTLIVQLAPMAREVLQLFVSV